MWMPEKSHLPLNRRGALPIVLSFAFILIPFLDLSFIGIPKQPLISESLKASRSSNKEIINIEQSKPKILDDVLTLTTKEVEGISGTDTKTVGQPKRTYLKDAFTDSAEVVEDTKVIVPASIKKTKLGHPSNNDDRDNGNSDDEDEINKKRPPLSKLIGDSGKITGDVQFLLDFAIVGHPKTGTDKQMHYISRHPEIQMYEYEVRSLRDGKPIEFVNLMYNLPEGSHYKRGYKAPRDVVVKSKQPLMLLDTYWPKTKLIVGLRHPVKWFESYYNYRKRSGWDLPPAETMVGKRMPEEVMYHLNLAQLGKTNPRGNHKEARLLGLSNKDHEMDDSPNLAMKNQVLLYDSSQPFDANRTRAEIYWQDLSNYIGVSKPFVPPKLRKKSNNKGFAIDICEDKFAHVRAELVEIGKAASDWIQNYFMVLPEVKTSSPEFFKETLSTWRHDPCDEASKK